MSKSATVSFVLLLAFAGAGVAAPGPQGPTFRGKPFRVWLRMVKADDPRERLRAVETLAVIGPEMRAAVPMLLAALKDEAEDVRCASAKALGEVGPGLPKVVDALTKALNNSHLHYNASRSLCRCGPQGLAVLKKTFPLADSETRYGIIMALKEAPPMPAALPMLIAGLKEPNKDTRRCAARAVARLGADAKQAVPALRTMMQHDEDDYLRVDAATALVKVADAKVSVAALVELMRGDGRSSRRDAVSLLGEMGTKAIAAVPALRAALNKKEDREVRATAALALWQIDRQTTGIPALVSCLAESEDPFLRIILMQYLLEIGPDAVPFLTEWLMRRQEGKARAWPPDKRLDKSAVVPNLVHLLADRDAEMRVLAARLVGVLGTAEPAAIAALAKALRDKDKHVRREAARVLALLGKETAAVVPVLHETLQKASRQESDRAAWLLWRIERKPAALVPALIARLKVGEHDDAEDHVFAAEILGWIGCDARPAIPALRKVLRGASALLQRAAADALGKIGGPIEEVLPDLLAATEEDDPLLRVAALRALACWGEKARPARTIIADRMRDKEPLVRLAAATAWQRIQPSEPFRRPIPSLAENELLVSGWTLREWLRRDGPPDYFNGFNETHLAVLRAASPYSPATVRGLAEALKARQLENRARAMMALRELGPKGREAVPVLLAQLKDKHAAIRRAAAESLRQIDPKRLNGQLQP